LPVLDDIVATGSAAIGFSGKDDIKAIKKLAFGKISLIGNLNGIDIVNWDKEKTRKEVKKLIREAAVGGGFILSDNHGEIPYQVPEDVLLEISETIREYGTYPIQVKD
jgi:uroporphyrinogen decarboxylase